MEVHYKTHRNPDTQYQDRLRQILETGDMIRDTPQGIGALTCFGTLAPMVFDLTNGFPIITERSLKTFWMKPIAEITAFINGARTLDEIRQYGCDFWEAYRGKGEMIGLGPDDMGPGSYGPSFAKFEMPDGGYLNQFEQLLQQITEFPSLRTHLISPWKPYYTARGPNRKVIVAPCHGWLHFRVINGRLDMEMHQRSADFPIGVPSNMVQYAALLLMVSRTTGIPPGRYIHSFADAHIYENQLGSAQELVSRPPLPLPVVQLREDAGENLFAFRATDFVLSEYEAHAAMKVAFAP